VILLSRGQEAFCANIHAPRRAAASGPAVTESPGGVNGELTYDPEIGPGYFTQIRSDFMRHEGFKPLVKVLYIVLLSYAAEGVAGRSHPGAPMRGK
jgi:hypothetical protein